MASMGQTQTCVCDDVSHHAKINDLTLPTEIKTSEVLMLKFAKERNTREQELKWILSQLAFIDFSVKVTNEFLDMIVDYYETLINDVINLSCHVKEESKKREYLNRQRKWNHYQYEYVKFLLHAWVNILEMDKCEQCLFTNLHDFLDITNMEKKEELKQGNCGRHNMLTSVILPSPIPALPAKTLSTKDVTKHGWQNACMANKLAKLTNEWEQKVWQELDQKEEKAVKQLAAAKDEETVRKAMNGLLKISQYHYQLMKFAVNGCVKILDIDDCHECLYEKTTPGKKGTKQACKEFFDHWFPDTEKSTSDNPQAVSK